MANSYRSIKKQYHKILVKAQRKFQRNMQKEVKSLETLEALRTGGQFSFKGKNTIPEINAEVFRISRFLNKDLSSNLELSEAAARGEEYQKIFKAGLSMQEREERGFSLQGNFPAQFYSIYHKLEERGLGTLLEGSLMSSDQVQAYLYSYAVDSNLSDPEEYDAVLNRGIELVNKLDAANKEFDIELPVTAEDFNRRGGFNRRGRF